MATFDVELRNPGSGFDVVLAASSEEWWDPATQQWVATETFFAHAGQAYTLPAGLGDWEVSVAVEDVEGARSDYSEFVSFTVTDPSTVDGATLAEGPAALDRGSTRTDQGSLTEGLVAATSAADVDAASLAESASIAVQAASTDDAATTEQATALRDADHETSDIASLNEGSSLIEADGAATDTAAASDLAALEAASSRTDDATASETATSALTVGASDTAAASDASAVSAAATRVDAGTLGESVVGIALGAGDGASLSEAAAITVAHVATDDGDLTDASSVDRSAQGLEEDLLNVDDDATVAAEAGGGDGASLSELTQIGVARSDAGAVSDAVTTQAEVGYGPDEEIRQVQAKATDVTSATSLTLAYDQTPTAGNLLVAFGHYAAQRVPTIPEGWSLAVETVTGAPETVVFYRVAGPDEPTDVTLSVSGAAVFISLAIFEYAGLHDVQAEVVDTLAYDSATSVSQLSTGTTPQTVQRNELLLASIGVNGGRTFAPFTNAFTTEVTTRRHAVASRIVAAPGQYETTASWDSSVSNAVATLVAFRGGERTPLPHESGVLTDTTAMAVSSARNDAATLVEVVAVTVVAASADAAALGEHLATVASVTGSEAAALAEASLLEQRHAATDGGALAEGAVAVVASGAAGDSHVLVDAGSLDVPVGSLDSAALSASGRVDSAASRADVATAADAAAGSATASSTDVAGLSETSSIQLVIATTDSATVAEQPQGIDAPTATADAAVLVEGRQLLASSARSDGALTGDATGHLVQDRPVPDDATLVEAAGVTSAPGSGDTASVLEHASIVVIAVRIDELGLAEAADPSVAITSHEQVDLLEATTLTVEALDEIVPIEIAVRAGDLVMTLSASPLTIGSTAAGLHTAPRAADLEVRASASEARPEQRTLEGVSGNV